MSGLRVIHVSDGQAVAPEVSYRLLGRAMGEINGPAIVYFEAGWCVDCRGNESAFEEFIKSAAGLKPDVTLLRVVASVERGDWRMSEEQGDGPNWQNPFRTQPWEVRRLPHAVVAQYSNGSPQILERVMTPDGLGLDYLLDRAGQLPA